MKLKVRHGSDGQACGSAGASGAPSGAAWLAAVNGNWKTPAGREIVWRSRGAATPAMLMTGAAIGPIVGGTLVKAFGYGSLGATALVIGAIAVFCFSRIPASSNALPHQQVPA